MSGVVQAAEEFRDSGPAEDFGANFAPGYPPDFPEDLSLPRALRLSDAERIASERLDGAGPGSLKEALATSVVADADGALRLTERLERMRTLTDSVTPLRSFQAAPAVDLGWFAAVPPAHAFAEPEDMAEQGWTVAATFPAPIVAPAAQPSAEVGLDFIRRTPLQVPLFEADMSVLADAPDAPDEAPSFGFAEAGLSFYGAHVDGDDAAPLTPLAPGGAAPGAIALPVDRETGVSTPIDPIATAFVASARLAADAAAASQTLHSLKMLLTDTLREEQAAHPPTGAPAAAAPEDEPLFDAPAIGDVDPEHAPAAAESAPVRIAAQPEKRVPAPVLPPPLPPVQRIGAVAPAAPAVPKQGAQPQAPAAAIRAIAPTDARAARPAARAETARPQRRAARPVPRVAPADTARTPLDVGGFCAGFALSGAIGVLLYFVMTAS